MTLISTLCALIVYLFGGYLREPDNVEQRIQARPKSRTQTNESKG